MKRIVSISLFLFLCVSGTAHAIDFIRISDYELCTSATGRVNLEPRKWDPREKYQPYIAEAKRRGISCRVGSRQGLDGLSRATRAEKPVLRAETSNAPENCKLSKLTIIEIQTAAQALGLYKSSIDGIAGNGTTGAIKAAKKLFTKTASNGDCVTAGDLAELKALAEVNKALALSKTCNADQIDKCSDVQTCEKATILQDSLRRWNLDNIAFVNRAKNLSLDCKITVNKTPYNQEEAKYYLSLLTDFVGQNPAAFDLKFATEFGSVRPILSDQWSSDLSKSFEEFRLYLVNFPEFEQYLDAKKAAVDAEEKVRIDQLRAALVQNQSLLEAWAKQNVLDKKAEQVAGLIAAISDENNQSVNGLELLVSESQALLSATGIKDVPATQETKAKINGLFEPTSVYVFINRSGDAGSVYKNLEGKTAFEQGRGSYCASDKLDPMDFYILQGKIFGLWSDLKGLDAKSCGRDTDVFIVQGNEITSDRLYNAIALSDLEQAVEFTMQQRDEEYGRLTFLKDTIEQDVINGTRIGFGALTVESSEGPMCAVLNDKQQAHGEILTSNQTLLKVYGINDAKFSDVFSGENEAFKSLQRQQCGMIYGSALSLGRLYLAGKSAGIKLEFLPLWVSPREVDEKNTALEAEKTQGAQQLNTAMQSIEDQQRLEQEAQRTLAEKATIRQRELREQNGLRFTIIKDQLQAEIFAAIDFAYNNSPDDAGYVAKYVEQTFVDKDTRYSPYDRIIANVQQMAAEKWEITEKTVSQIDYGSTKFNDREVEGLVVELKMASKNRLIGKYSEYCKRVHVMNDADFEIWREFEMSECNDNGATANWQTNWAFDSKWVVEGAE